MPRSSLTPVELDQSRILVLRGQRVILAADLARLYGVHTRRLNEQVRRNARKSPENFVVELTRDEAESRLRSRSAKCDLKARQEHQAPALRLHRTRALQATNVLNSAAGVEMSVHVVRAFVQLRQMLGNHRAPAAKLLLMAAPDSSHDRDIAFHRGNR